jgi:hypothetical protein
MSIEITRNEDGTLTEESSKQMSKFQYEYTQALFIEIAKLSAEDFETLVVKQDISILMPVINSMNQLLIDAEYPMAALNGDGGIHKYADEIVKQVAANVFNSFNLTTEAVFASVCGRSDFGLVTTKDVSETFKRFNTENKGNEEVVEEITEVELTTAKDSEVIPEIEEAPEVEEVKAE